MLDAATALASDGPALASKPPRNRAIDARRAARAAKAKREQRIMAHLVKGVSVAELAGREGVSERRMRAIVQDILSRRMPEPPAEFLALQVARLNEAMIVAHGAMANGNLKAVECVMKLTRELDRYHGFAEAIEARPATAERRRLAAPGARDARPPIRLQMAPQVIENLQFTPEHGAPPEAAGSPEEKETAAEAAIDPAAIAEASSAAVPEPAPTPPALEAPPASGRLQAIENLQLAPGNGAPPEAAGSAEEPATEVPPADLADPAATPRAAPEAETDPQSMDEAAPAGTLDPDPAETVPAVPPPGMVVGNVILPPYTSPQPGPTAFTGYIRCAGVTTYYSR
jgi:hypothetical protein